MTSLGIKQALTEAQQSRFQGRGNVKDNSINAVAKAASMFKGGAAGLALNLGTKVLLKTGIADKLTNGKATRFLTGLYTLFHPNVGVKSQYADNVAQVSKYIGNSAKSVSQVLNKNV